jgi:hypothetical protein
VPLLHQVLERKMPIEIEQIQEAIIGVRQQPFDPDQDACHVC